MLLLDRLLAVCRQHGLCQGINLRRKMCTVKAHARHKCPARQPGKTQVILHVHPDGAGIAIGEITHRMHIPCNIFGNSIERQVVTGRIAEIDYFLALQIYAITQQVLRANCLENRLQLHPHPFIGLAQEKILLEKAGIRSSSHP